MTSRNKVVAVVVALVVVFLIGFLPQYLEKRQLQTDLAASREAVRFSEVRDLAGMMLLEVLRQNYGVARDYSTQYFAKLAEASDATEDAALKSSLQELLDRRDSITTSLATADPASTSEVQTLFIETHRRTKTP